MQTITNQEKRQFPRKDSEFEVTFTVNNDDTSYQGQSQNISANGIYITTLQFLQLGARIALHLPVKDIKASTTLVQGRVVRCKFDKANTDLFHISIEFLKPLEQTIDSIKP